jgi:hypothetical protein
MDQATQQNAAMVEESNAASHTLVTEVSALSARLGQFNLGRRQGGPSRAGSTYSAPCCPARAPDGNARCPQRRSGACRSSRQARSLPGPCTRRQARSRLQFGKGTGCRIGRRLGRVLRSLVNQATSNGGVFPAVFVLRSQRNSNTHNSSKWFMSLKAQKAGGRNSRTPT